MSEKKEDGQAGSGDSVVKTLLEKYRRQPGGALSVLQEYQDMCGSLPDQVIKEVARCFGRSEAEIEDLLYSHDVLQQETPGRHRISVCMGTSCYLHGEQSVLNKFAGLLGINPGQATPDGEFYLEAVRCLGACDLGPSVLIDDEVHPFVKPDKVAAIIRKYRQSPDGEK